MILCCGVEIEHRHAANTWRVGQDHFGQLIITSGGRGRYIHTEWVNMMGHTRTTLRRTALTGIVAAFLVTLISLAGLPLSASASEVVTSSSQVSSAPAVNLTPTIAPTSTSAPTPTTSDAPTASASNSSSSPSHTTSTAPTAPSALTSDKPSGPGHVMGSAGKSAPLANATKPTTLNRFAQLLTTPAYVATQPTGTEGMPAGMDVSGWQQNVDWATAWNQGARFAYIKASEGPWAMNDYFSQQYNGAAAQGIIRGAYTFARPNLSSGANQAQVLVQSGGGWSPDGMTLPGVLDIESNTSDSSGACFGMSPAALTSWVHDFSNTYKSLTGRDAVIYTAYYFWQQCLGSSDFSQSNPLWIAAYGAPASNVWMPGGWPQYTFWQFSSEGPFVGDSNVFNGSYDQLKTIATGGAAAISNPSIRNTNDVLAIDGSGVLWDYPAATTGIGSKYVVMSGWSGFKAFYPVDWNQDGVIDLIAQWNNGTVSFYKGLRTGGFESGVVIGSGSWQNLQLTVGKWRNGDHYPGIMAKDSSGALYYYANPSGGALANVGILLGTGWGPLDINMATWDAGGNPAVLARDRAGNILLYRSDGSGNIVNASPPVIGTGWQAMTSISVLTAPNGGQSLAARWNTGELRNYALSTGGWGPVTSFGTGWNPLTLGASPRLASPAIFSADDTLAIDQSGTLWNYPSTSGSIGAPFPISSGWKGLTSYNVTDWNNDGTFDLVGQVQNGDVYLYWGNPAGGFGSPVIIARVPTGAKVTPARWNSNDPYPGLLVSLPYGAVTYLKNSSGTATLDAASSVTSSSTGSQVAVGDWNGDQIPDLISRTPGGDLKVQLGDGTGKVRPQPAQTIGTGWTNVASIRATATFIGGGKLGLLALWTSGELKYYGTTGQGSWTSVTSMGHRWAGSSLPGAVAPGPAGILDAGDQLSVDANGVLWDYPLNADGTLGTRFALMSGWSGYKSLFPVDWNADGTVDIIAQWNSGPVTFYRGLPEGGFAPGTPITSGDWSTQQLAIGTWNSTDKRPGLFAKDNAGSLSYFSNLSNNQLATEGQSLGVGWNSLDVVAAKWASTTRTDILARNVQGQMLWYRSDGSGNLVQGPAPVIGTGWQSVRSLQVSTSSVGKQSISAIWKTGELVSYQLPANGTWGLVSNLGYGWDTLYPAGIMVTAR